MFWSISGKFLFWHIFQGPLWHNFPDLKFTGPRITNTFLSMSLHLILIPVTAHLLLIYILFVPTSLPWKPYSLSQKVTLHLHFCLFHMVILVFSRSDIFSRFTCWFLFFLYLLSFHKIMPPPVSSFSSFSFERPFHSFPAFAPVTIIWGQK